MSEKDKKSAFSEKESEISWELVDRERSFFRRLLGKKKGKHKVKFPEIIGSGIYNDTSSAVDDVLDKRINHYEEEGNKALQAYLDSEEFEKKQENLKEINKRKEDQKFLEGLKSQSKEDLCDEVLRLRGELEEKDEIILGFQKHKEVFEENEKHLKDLKDSFDEAGNLKSGSMLEEIVNQVFSK